MHGLTEEQHEKLIRRFVELGVTPQKSGERVALVFAVAEKRNIDPWPLCVELFFSDDYQAAAQKFIQKYADR